jgi:hypothetical protein
MTASRSSKAVTKRLLHLENRLGLMMKAARRAAIPSGTELIAANLARLGMVREGAESLAEATARATGISMAELRNRLLTIATGNSK